MIPDELAAAIAENEARSKSNTKRLDKVEARQDKLDQLVTSVALIAQKQEAIDDDVKEIKADVKALSAKPGQRWEDFVGKLFWLVVAAVVGFTLARLGLG